MAGFHDPLHAQVARAPRHIARTGGVELITIDEMQRRHIRGALAATEGRVCGEKGAAKILGLKPSTLQSRIKRLGR